MVLHLITVEQVGGAHIVFGRPVQRVASLVSRGLEEPACKSIFAVCRGLAGSFHLHVPVPV